MHDVFLFGVVMSHENLKHIQSKVWVCAHQSRLCWLKPSGTYYWMISLIDMTVLWLRNTTFCLLYTRSRPFQLPSCFGAVLVLLSFTLAYLIPENVPVAAWIWATFWKCPLKCLPSFVVLYCPLVATHRTTVAPLPVFWGARPVAVASRGTWTTLLFLTFLTWVAFLRTIKDAAMVWARCLLGCCFGFIPFQCTSRCREAWSQCVCVIVETTVFCDEAEFEMCF